jgi:hypothetical protein
MRKPELTATIGGKEGYTHGQEYAIFITCSVSDHCIFRYHSRVSSDTDLVVRTIYMGVCQEPRWGGAMLGASLQ